MIGNWPAELASGARSSSEKGDFISLVKMSMRLWLGLDKLFVSMFYPDVIAATRIRV